MNLQEEVRKGHTLPDVLLNGSIHTRPIRRSIELFRSLAPPNEWGAFLAFQMEELEDTTNTRNRRYVLEVLTMALEDRVLMEEGVPTGVQIGATVVPVRSTKNARRVQTGKYPSFSKWLKVAPEWYKKMLLPSLEMWALQVPSILDSEDKRPNRFQENLRKSYLGFSKGCFGYEGEWDDHDYAEKRIKELQARINDIPTPRMVWTNVEVQTMGGIVTPGSFADLLAKQDKIPAPTTEKCPSASAVRRLRNKALNDVEEAAYEALLRFYPNIAEVDVVAWPFQPICVPLMIGRGISYVVMVFRSSGRSSKVPRIFHTFGSFNIMAKVDEKTADSDHPKYLGELNLDGDKVVLFDGNDGSIFVRTWINGSMYRDGEDIAFTKKGWVFHHKYLDGEAACAPVSRKIKAKAKAG